MSRLHRQKLRLRSQQRADGLIESDGRAIDRDAFQEVGSTHAGVRRALELVERHGASEVRPQTLPTPTGGQMGRFLDSLTPGELEDLRAQFARRRRLEGSEPQASGQAGAGGAQNPPL